MDDSKVVAKKDKSDEPDLGDEIYGPLDVTELDEKPKPVSLGQSESAIVNNEEMVL